MHRSIAYRSPARYTRVIQNRSQIVKIPNHPRKRRLGIGYPGKHVVQWNWNLKSGAPKEKLVCALI
jgi:hypothetical protein